MGNNRVSISPVACWVNDDGDRMVELNLKKKGIKAGRYSDLGSRYICASKAKWEAEAKRYRTHFPNKEFIDISPDRLGATENESALFKDRFIVYPHLYDRSFRNEKPREETNWVKVKAKGYPLTFVMQVDDKDEKVRLQRFSEMNSYDQKDWWWYPTRVLYAPAAVVDVAMLPITVPVVIYGVLHMFDF